MEMRKYIYLFIAIICMSGLVVGKNIIMVVHPTGQAFSDVLEGINAEIDQEEYKVIPYSLKKLSAGKLKDEISRNQPVLIILMDNKSVSLYKKSNITTKIPVLAMMGVNIQSAIEGIPNSGAISYEIPIVTSLVNLRSVLNRDISTVGVIARSNMKEFVKHQKKFCKNEKIRIIHINIASCPLFYLYKPTLRLR